RFVPRVLRLPRRVGRGEEDATHHHDDGGDHDDEEHHAVVETIEVQPGGDRVEQHDRYQAAWGEEQLRQHVGTQEYPKVDVPGEEDRGNNGAADREHAQVEQRTHVDHVSEQREEHGSDEERGFGGHRLHRFGGIFHVLDSQPPVQRVELWLPPVVDDEPEDEHREEGGDLPDLPDRVHEQQHRQDEERLDVHFHAGQEEEQDDRNDHREQQRQGDAADVQGDHSHREALTGDEDVEQQNPKNVRERRFVGEEFAFVLAKVGDRGGDDGGGDHRQRGGVDEAQQPPLGEGELNDHRDERNRKAEHECSRSGCPSDQWQFLPVDIEIEARLEKDENEPQHPEELDEVEGDLHVASRCRRDLPDADPEQQQHEHRGDSGAGAEDR